MRGYERDNMDTPKFIMHLITHKTLALLICGSFAATACSDDDGDPIADGDAGIDEGIGDGDPGEGAGEGEGEGDGDGDDTSEGDGDGATTEGGADDLCAGACGAPNCGACPDGEDIAISNYTIGGTEVTYGQYGQFLAIAFDPGYLTGLLPAECAFKADFIPDQWPVHPAPTIPVAGVDWCDAAAYCAWSGRRLCGAIGGGPAALHDVQNAAANEWFRACSGGGVSNYPYGLNYDPSLCNTKDAGFDQTVEVGILAGCEGGSPGLFDMSGNVWEWTHACNDDGECQRRGGSYFSDGPSSRCAINSVRARDHRNNNTGIRCCNSL